jgi:predicted sulfurtransferase
MANTDELPKFLVLAFYKFVELKDPLAIRDELRTFCGAREMRGTILLAHEGINSTVSGTETALRELQEWFAQRPEFSDLPYKESWAKAQTFRRMLVKLKREVISMGRPTIRPAEKTGPRIKPLELKKWLDEGKEVFLIDTRNDYEIKQGTFEGALDMGLKRFRQFPEFLSERLDELKTVAKSKPIVMFCTGGIRCEKATALAEELGLSNVYQLDGGILKYFEDCGPAHYQGECFVFDKRLALDGSLHGEVSTTHDSRRFGGLE